MTFTVIKTVEVFDESKIGKGDIVSFARRTVNMFGTPKIDFVRAGVVTAVDPETIWVSDHEELKSFGIPIHRADEITMLFRSRHNVGRGEIYGGKGELYVKK